MRVLLIILAMSPFALYAQGFNPYFMLDQYGRPVKIGNNINVQGSPYFNNDFCPVTFKVSNSNKIYAGVRARINLNTNEVTYDDPKKGEMLLTLPVEAIELEACPSGEKKRFRTGFPAVDKQNGKTFYQVLDSGNALLLKYYQVTYMDNKDYNSTDFTRVYEQKPFYYALLPGKGMVKLSRGAGEVPSLFADKRADITAFIKKEDIDLKKEEDLVKTFAYYNKLTGK